MISEIAGRVLGCLIEKELTAGQPLTLNALVLACNQAHNRDPVMDLEVGDVETALDELKDARLIRFVLPSAGRSAIRYRQVLDEVHGGGLPIAALAVLLLRGPSTRGEIRARADRLGEAGDIDENLSRLRELDLVVCLPRERGQKEDRWTQILSPAPSVPIHVPAASPDDEPARPIETLSGLRDDLESLRADLGDLRSQLDELRQSLGG